MTPKLVYTLNGVEKTYEFLPSDISNFHQEWESDEIEYKNPLIGKKDWKRRGYYYKATLSYDGAEYSLTEEFRDLFNTTISDRKFYPNKDIAAEYYEVEVSDNIGFNDDHTALAVTDIEIIFRSKHRSDTPFNYPADYWGDRRTTWDDDGDELFGED